MRDLAIAYGNSCMAKTWLNKTIQFDALCERLKNTIRTSETVAEYPKLPKADRDRIKDKGGFVGGKLAGGRRKKDTVVCRSMLTHDADHATEDFIERYELLYGYKSCLYTTHSHTPENPRVRIITPLARDVTPDEYAAITRYIAAELGIDCFDPCSYIPHQLMYWPTTPSDGEYIFTEVDGEVLDPDKFLAAHPDWRDCFTITQAIDRFLPSVYVPSTIPGRYSYAEADSVAGLVIYDDDTFAYSHHATDPAYQMEMNAFDLVRVHLYPDEDEKKSFKAMADFAITVDEVKRELTRMRLEQANEDFSGDDWQTALEYDRKGNLVDSLDNLVLVLRNDEELHNIAFNLHWDGIDANGGLPWDQLKDGWNDSDYAALKVYLSNRYGLYSPTKTKDAILAVAAERSYHPIKEYLEALPDWDGVPRIDTLYIDYLGADDTTYSRAVSRKSMVAAVARIYEPGVKFDSVPILNGPQGIGKSTLFYKLAGKWFSDSLSLTDMKDKSGPEKLQGYWILELGELAGMRKTDVETVKSFISRVDDKYRASYGVTVESHPRQCIIVGSTNAESGFLRDITGNRRFWPIRVSGNSAKKPWMLTKGDVEQLWAEALVIYRKGEKLYLEGAEALQAITERVIGLTGTPAPNSLLDLWPEMYLLDQGQRLGRFIGGFRDRFFLPDKRNREIIYSYKPKDGAEKDIYRLISDICISMKATDFLEMPERVENNVEVVMAPKEKKLYDDFKRDMVLQLGDDELDAVNAAALSNKLLQMANGAIYGEEKKVFHIHDKKLDALEDLVEAANGKPLLVACWYKHDLQRIRERFPEARCIDTPKDIADWNDGKIQMALIAAVKARIGG